MQLISTINKAFRFLLSVFDIYSKNALLKCKKGITITVFQKTLDESNHKRNKIWLDKGS